LNARLKGVETEFKADLVVSFTRATVGDELASLFLGDSDLGASDDRAGKRRAEQVDVLVRGVALNSREAQLADELVNDILDCRR
jgi:hypothetical protein